MKEQISLEERIRALVKEEFEKMTLSKRYCNQSRLANRCQAIIYKEWGIGNDNIWKRVDDVIKEFIPDEID